MTISFSKVSKRYPGGFEALRNVTLVRGETSREKTVRIEAPARQPEWCR